jgi:hypothetical protein
MALVELMEFMELMELMELMKWSESFAEGELDAVRPGSGVVASARSAIESNVIRRWPTRSGKRM